jgi:hypothetical protein
MQIVAYQQPSLARFLPPSQDQEAPPPMALEYNTTARDEYAQERQVRMNGDSDRQFEVYSYFHIWRTIHSHVPLFLAICFSEHSAAPRLSHARDQRAYTLTRKFGTFCLRISVITLNLCWVSLMQFYLSRTSCTGRYKLVYTCIVVSQKRFPPKPRYLQTRGTSVYSAGHTRAHGSCMA